MAGSGRSARQCNQASFQFHPHFQGEVRGRFDGGEITTDAAGLLRREVEQQTRIMARFADCFRDHRAAEQIGHTVWELVAQRVYALALGYEDLNDHDKLRRTTLLPGRWRKSPPPPPATASSSGSPGSDEFVMRGNLLNRLLTFNCLQVNLGFPLGAVLNVCSLLFASSRRQRFYTLDACPNFGEHFIFPWRQGAGK